MENENQLPKKSQELDVRTTEELDKAFSLSNMLLSKSYLPLLKTFEPKDIEYSAESAQFSFEELNKNVRFFDITQIVLNKNENTRDKLVSVFNAVNSVGASLLFFIKGEKDKVHIAFGLKSEKQNDSTSFHILEDSLKSNFPGTKIESLLPDLKNPVGTFYEQNYQSDKSFVSAVTGVPGIRSEQENKDRQFIQGIERVVDAMQGEEYTMLLIADSISSQDMNASRQGLESLYSSLVPYCESQLTFGQNESEGISSSVSKSVTKTITNGTSQSISHTHGTSHTVTDGTSSNVNINPGAVTSALGTVKGTSKGLVAGAIIGSIVPGVGTVVGAGIGASVGGAIGGAIGGLGNALSFSKGKNHSEADGTNDSDTTQSGESQSESNAESESETEGKNSNHGTSQTLQIKFENHTVKQLMKRIDETLKRYDNCADLGMWNCAMYCISESESISQRCASLYQGILRGKNSSLENNAITLWNKKQSNIVLNSLLKMQHPVFDIENMQITPGTLISSAELAIEAGLPNHSLPGLPVIECAEFGRTVSSYDEKEKPEDDEKIQLGKIYHMHSEEKLPVTLNINSLASHTFITGSTGSGKSFTVYRMLSGLKSHGKKFLVIEPAKGEYKNEFGKYADEVYGTNPKFSQLLRINPFSFYGDTHILEHLDRLIEIFNVCWPMYAAMPAVLKEAVEKSYEDCGWDLASSENKYDDKLFPTFSDVTRNIRSIIDSSDYDSDNKGAYKGSLITRLKSLSNGINGQIFTDDEISMEDLFKKNVIVDLSRVGSAETKSLIMGLLVLKLQEYRMNQGASKLKHVTVLEEAHNLLKRTSTEQSSESANLLGKSVEMLTNSIAEMRAFGEGFIIADQAPGLLDMAVIRNTNTKIILRLPDQSDRELVGKAAGLNDDQIKELAKLPCGVAAVYQNEWIEPVLCKVDEFTDKGKFEGKNDEQNIAKSDLKNRLEIAKLLCSTPNEPVILEDLKKLHLGGSVIAQYLDYKNSAADKPDFNRLSQLVSSVLFEFNETVRKATLENSNAELWRDRLSEKIDETFAENQINDENEELKRDILQCILQNLILNELKKPELLKELNPRGGAR